MAKNILLHFLNKASGDLYGLSGGDRNAHTRCLVEAINVAVFTCRDYCVMPPLFVAECPRAQRAVASRIGYCALGLIRVSMRERSFDEYFAKKDEEITDHRSQYGDLFDENARRFIRRQKNVFFLTRIRTIGDEMVEWWNAGPDQSGFFREMIHQLRVEPSAVEDLRKIPARIREGRGAVTWPAISALLNEKDRPPNFARLQQVVQHSYLGEYLTAHDLTVLTGLNFDRGLDFGLARGDYSHDWRVFGRALEIIGCWDTIKTLSAGSMYELRMQQGYFLFRNAVVSLGEASPSVDAAFQALSVMVGRMGGFKGWEALLNDLKKHKKKPAGVALPSTAVQAVGDLLAFAATSGLREFSGAQLLSVTPPAGTSRGRSWSRGVGVMTEEGPVTGGAREQIPVAIFCALEEEREYLIDKWGLGVHGETDYWRGKIEGIDCLLYSAEQMGRVPATLSTMRFLSSFAPEIIVVVGIAGGFENEGIDVGHLLIPRQIADLAARKIRQVKTGERAEFRPTVFDVNQRVVGYLNGAQWHREKDAWEASATKGGGWPKGKRPAIHVGGTTACTDEVVSSDTWVDNLRAAWPKLQGIEMEAGGVCAAARLWDNVPVVVLRGVSDLADPVKADNEWRKIAMKTLAALFEVLLRVKVIP